MTLPVDCFFAYSASPASLAEIIENAISEINSQGASLVVAHGWKSIGVTGKIIIKEICTAIDGCDIFACDLTTLSPNVLFELGYAIARNKRIWLTLDPSYEEAKLNFDRLNLFGGIGYASYQNHNHLVGLFFQERPFEDLQSTIYTRVLQSTAMPRDQKPSVLYLKSRIETEASIELSRLLAKSRVHLVIDDPQENNSQTLTWYVQNTRNTLAAIVHLLDDKRDKRYLQNAKYSFVAGLTYGFDKRLLMLAHMPFDPPVDYSDLLFPHETAANCIAIATDWMSQIGDMLLVEQQKLKEQLSDVEHTIALRKLSLGEDVAENEQDDLLDYFVPTAAYGEALRTPQSVIYIGRKGSGKTANLYKIADTLIDDPRNHVCVIKPVAYELEGVLRLLRLSVPRAEQGFMIESLWKFLIYTELALSVCADIEDRPVHYIPTESEHELIRYVDEHGSLIKAEFAIRMERAINDLCSIDPSNSITQQRARVSEILHTNILAQLRDYLGRVLEKKVKTCILIDNLDKSWIRGSDISSLSDFLFGLLSVSRSISDEFQRQGITWRPAKLSLLIFLRSDIFAYIMREARERDKLTYRRLEWNDASLLQRLIEERFLASCERMMPVDKVWQTFFAETVKGRPTKDYLTSRIIPKPRDMIYLCRAALAHAINHGHARIEESDILQAEKEYSQYAFNSLEAETSAQLEHLEDLLYEFAGANEIVTRDQINGFIAKSHILPEQEQYAIAVLCEATFLGLETDIGRFEFIYDENREEVVRVLAQKLAHARNLERYRINAPFHPYLEIKEQPV
jgi:hypothetical protein